MTKNKKAVQPSRWKGYVSRWRRLQADRAGVDLQVAALAHEIREEFTKGPGGNSQFRSWIVSNFDVGSSTAGMLLRAAHAYTLFDPSDWINFGGWRAIQLLTTLRPNGRRKVIKRCRERVSELGHPIGYDAVRRIAFDCGAPSNFTTGRPNRLKVEEDLGFLRNWLKRLYQDYEGLPPLPKPVQQALGGTRLSQIADEFKATS